MSNRVSNFSSLAERGDRCSAFEVGRHARLELAFACRNGRTVMTDAYAEPPFRIGRTFDVDGAAYVIIVSSGPGVFAGDRLHQMVSVERGARVLLASQSALQVHPSEAAEPAHVQQEYRVEDGGELHCQWDPIIPFADARVVQRFDVQLSKGSRLYWSDALMSGRSSRGEAWKFRELVHELRLRVNGSLQYLERYHLTLGDRPVRHSWIAGGADYLGTSLVYHDAATSVVAERLQREVDLVEGVRAGVEGVRAGVDLVEPKLVVGRLLAERGAPFARARAAFRNAVLAEIFHNPRLIGRR